VAQVVEVQARRSEPANRLHPVAQVVEVRPTQRAALRAGEHQCIRGRPDVGREVTDRSERIASGMLTVRTRARDFGGPTTIPRPTTPVWAKLSRTQLPSAAMSRRRSAVTSPQRSVANAVTSTSARSRG